LKKLLPFLVLFVSIIGGAKAQPVVKGTVSNDRGETLPGVNILIRNTTSGTSSDVNGSYTLSVPDLAKTELVFSFVGYQTQTVRLSGRSKLDVVLEEDLQSIEDVVVIGYGEVRKRDLTGSISRVSENENIARQYNTVDALLQGRAAGVQVSSNSGSPGGAISVRIRGTNSLRGNNEPLYVVDGVIINSAGEDVKNASTDANELQTDQNGLTGINPRDIESVEILKDASATAIYGSRGANGVVLITTKKGDSKEGNDKINIYSTTDLSWISKRIDLLDPIGYARFQNEKDQLMGSNPGYKIEGNQVYKITYSTDPEGQVISQTGTTPLPLIDWQDAIYELAISNNQGLSISGKRNKTNYYFSSGYNITNGIVASTNVKQGDLRMNISGEISPRLDFDSRISGFYQKGSFAQAGSRSGGNRSFTKQVLTYRPIVGYADETGEELDLEISNPYAWLEDYDDLTEEARLNLSTSFEYRISKDLKYKIQGGVDYRTKNRERWYGLGVFKGGLDNGIANYSDLNRKSYTVDNILTYAKRIRESDLTAMAAFTYDGSVTKNTIYEVSDFRVKTLRSKAPQLGQIVQQPYTLLYLDESIFSGIGRITYSLLRKYILTASLRADQSSKFAKGKQNGLFPSAAFAWHLGEENFIKKLGWFHNLKYRLGFGITGNQAILPYQTLPTYSTVYYVDAGNNTLIGSVPSRIANEKLTWETTRQWNTGLDISLLKGKLNATVDLYYKTTRDLLQELQLPTSTGFGFMTVNRGEIANKGIEVSVDGMIFSKKEFSLEAGGHISINRNKVLKLGLPASEVWIDKTASQEVFYLGNEISSGNYLKAPANIFMEGKPLGMFWGYQTGGIYQDQPAADAGPKYFGNPNKAGDLIFIDQNGDGNISITDRTFIGNPNPDFTYGMNLTATYRNLTLKVLLDGVYGNQIVNGYNQEIGFAEMSSKNILADAYFNAWRADNPSNTNPRIGFSMQNQGFCDFIIEDGSYMRLNNITLGYDVKFKKQAVKNLNLYVSGRNLFYITRYSGYEPQVTSYLFDGSIMGVDWVGTPNVKSVLIGLNLVF